MANGWALIIGLAIVVALAAAGYVFAPKGEDQLIWRNSIILSLACFYLMWALTFLAQWHPLVHPQRSDFKKGYIE